MTDHLSMDFECSLQASDHPGNEPSGAHRVGCARDQGGDASGGLVLCLGGFSWTRSSLS